jgi:hypothetical protein
VRCRVHLLVAAANLLVCGITLARLMPGGASTALPPMELCLWSPLLLLLPCLLVLQWEHAHREEWLRGLQRQQQRPLAMLPPKQLQQGWPLAAAGVAGKPKAS